MFFRVKQPIKIGSKVFQTCICYPLSAVLKDTVESLVKEDKAEIYEKEVFFVNGKPFVKQEAAPKKAVEKTKPLAKETESQDGKSVKDF